MKNSMYGKTAGCLSFILGALPASAFAGGAAAGNVVSTLVQQEGVAFVQTNGSRSGAPSCTTVSDRFAINLGSPGGRAAYATELAAAAMGKNHSGGYGCLQYLARHGSNFLSIFGDGIAGVGSFVADSASVQLDDADTFY